MTYATLNFIPLKINKLYYFRREGRAGWGEIKGDFMLLPELLPEKSEIRRPFSIQKHLITVEFSRHYLYTNA